MDAFKRSSAFAQKSVKSGTPLTATKKIQAQSLVQ